jgi:spore coat protein A
MTERFVTSETELSRRRYLTAAGIAGLSALSGCLMNGSETGGTGDQTPTRGQTAAERHTSPELSKWVDEVPRPDTAEPTGQKNGQPYYQIEMREVEQTLHRELPATTVWGYDGQYPGPTIEAQQGEPIYVRWQNNLPDSHLLPEDTTIHDDIVPYDSTGVRTVTHLHGGNIEAESDGHMQAWFTREFQQTGPRFEKRDYRYVNDQPPATLWYHDHSTGITRLNVYAGLAGLYLLRSDHERGLGLPTGEYEIPLVLQDRSFNEDGSLYYPSGPVTQDSAESELPEPSIVPQFYGDVSVVNGKAWPRLSVEPRRYRLRLLNGANSRYYSLALHRYDERAGETTGAGPSLTQIGTDGGLLSHPVEIERRLELGSSERADVVVDFSDHAGETLLLHNNAPAMYHGVTDQTTTDVEPLTEIMLVDVDSSPSGADTSQVPESLTAVPELSFDVVDNRRYLPLVQSSDDYGRPMPLLGSADNRSGNRLTDPPTETPTVGETELWTVANLTGMTHPIHLHLVHFQVLGRQSIDYDPADTVDPDTLREPEPSERGWNDVVNVDPGDVVHLLVHFGEYDGLFNDQTGRYMWHCHMLEHEDHDMMRPMEVLPSDEDTPAGQQDRETR